jgi:hypothetical protein
MGHNKVTTTLGIYTHLFNTDDHANAVAATGRDAGPFAGSAAARSVITSASR